MEDFTDKVVIIVGATSVIGSAAAVMYVQRGASVILCDSKENELKEIVTQCQTAEAKENQIYSLAGDITNPQTQTAVLQLAVDRFNRLDVLVNAAETKIPGSPIPGVDMADFQTTLDNNLTAVAKICQAAIPLLRQSNGNIVNVSSSLGHKATKNQLAFCVSKAGLDMLTKCLALELAPHGIRVNAVKPGVAVADTDETENSDSAEYLKVMAHKTPMGRLAKAEEVADAIVYLSSDRASIITGHLMDVDGGFGL